MISELSIRKILPFLILVASAPLHAERSLPAAPSPSGLQSPNDFQSGTGNNFGNPYGQYGNNAANPAFNSALQHQANANFANQQFDQAKELASREQTEAKILKDLKVAQEQMIKTGAKLSTKRAGLKNLANQLRETLVGKLGETEAGATVLKNFLQTHYLQITNPTNSQKDVATLDISKIKTAEDAQKIAAEIKERLNIAEQVKEAVLAASTNLPDSEKPKVMTAQEAVSTTQANPFLELEKNLRSGPLGAKGYQGSTASNHPGLPGIAEVKAAVIAVQLRHGMSNTDFIPAEKPSEKESTPMKHALPAQPQKE